MLGVDVSPNPPADLGSVTSLDGGENHNCAIKTDGIAQCWGSDYYGQSIVPADLGTVISLSSGAITTVLSKQMERPSVGG